MVQRSGRFKTAHTGWYLSAKAYGEVRRFETALYGALFRGQSKKRYLHALFSSEFLRSRFLGCKGRIISNPVEREGFLNRSKGQAGYHWRGRNRRILGSVGRLETGNGQGHTRPPGKAELCQTSLLLGALGWITANFCQPVTQSRQDSCQIFLGTGGASRQVDDKARFSHASHCP